MKEEYAQILKNLISLQSTVDDSIKHGFSQEEKKAMQFILNMVVTKTSINLTELSNRLK